LQLGSLSREQLINLIESQLLINGMETKKQLEAVKKETDESAKIAKELSTLKKEHLATQEQVKELTREMANLNVEHQQQKQKFEVIYWKWKRHFLIKI
jgi:predicted nuclease with TOPRIM domain